MNEILQKMIEISRWCNKTGCENCELSPSKNKSRGLCLLIQHPRTWERRIKVEYKGEGNE